MKRLKAGTPASWTNVPFMHRCATPPVRLASPTPGGGAGGGDKIFFFPRAYVGCPGKDSSARAPKIAPDHSHHAQQTADSGVDGP